jgi:Methyltransferase domain
MTSSKTTYLLGAMFTGGTIIQVGIIREKRMIWSRKKVICSTRRGWFTNCNRRYTGSASYSFSRCALCIIGCCSLIVFLLSWSYPNNYGGMTTMCQSNDANNSLNVTSFQLAYNHSYGYFQDIPDAEWERYYRQPALQSRHYRYPQDHDRYTNNQSASWIFSNWDPYFVCPHVRKIGGLGGGPKWVCDIDRLQKQIEQRRTTNSSSNEFWFPSKSFNGNSVDKVAKISQKNTMLRCLVYSIGSNGNYIWEDALFDVLGNDCEIHIFDPDPFDRPGMAIKKNMHFHQWGLGSSYSMEWMDHQRRPKNKKKRGQLKQNKTYYSFQEIQKRLGHENSTIDLFKIDCEGCEWHTYKDWIKADLRQILIETHELPTSLHEKRTIFGVLPAESASEVFDTFYNNGFVLFFKEVNTMKGYGFSSEWSFLKLNGDFFRMNKQSMESRKY